MSEKSEHPAPIGPRMIHPLERAAIRIADEQVSVGPSRPALPSPTTTPPALVGSGPTREAESAPAPLGEASGAEGATGGAEFPMSAVERALRVELATLAARYESSLQARAQYLREADELRKERDQARGPAKIIRTAFDARVSEAEKARNVAVAERDGMEKRLNEAERKMAASWDEQKAATRERTAELEKALDEARKEVEATHRENRELQIENRHLAAIAEGHDAFLRAFKFPADAHPLINALMERIVRVMGMEAAGGACNPHAVVCAALDAAHTFAVEDGTPATARLRDIVRVSVAEVDRLKEREQDATHYHGEWMRERGVAEALAAEIGDKAAFKAVKRAKARAAREAGQRVGALLKWAADNNTSNDPIVAQEAAED